MKLSNIECIIDAHTHLPINPSTTPRMLLKELNREGVNAAIILGVPSVRSLLESIDSEKVNREYEKTREFLKRYYKGSESLDPERLLLSALNIITKYGRLCHFSPVGDNYLVLAGADLSKKPEELADELDRFARIGFRGFKIITTIFMKYLDDPRVEAVYEVADSHGLPIVVHAGCDPGIWELPGYCKYGDPSRLDRILREYRDVNTVIAHMGSYSYIVPGVFLDETIMLVRKYENVYVDTSAVPKEIIRVGVKTIPTDRILFGSDYPVVDGLSLSSHIHEVYMELKRSGLPDRDVNKIFWSNASRLFEFRC